MSWLLLFLVLVAGPVDPSWRAWLLDPADGDLIAVDATGETLQALRLPQVPASQVSVSASGQYLAYMTEPPDASPVLTVFDTRQNQPLIARQVADYRTLPARAFLAHAQAPFSPDETRLAFGESLAVDDSWQITVLNLLDGTPAHVLRGLSSLPGTAGAVPFVRVFDGRYVGFMLVVDDLPSGYVWDTVAGDVRPDARWAVLDGAYYPPSGDVVAPRFDNRYPLDRRPLTATQHPAQTLTVFRPEDESFVFHTEADADFRRVAFAHRGEHLLVDYGDDLFHVFSRQGDRLTTWTPDQPPERIFTTQTGAVYSVRLADATRLLAFDAPYDADPRLIWQDDAAWTLLWAGGQRLDAVGLPAWARVPPVFGSRGLLAGRPVEINTAFQATLNLRLQPRLGDRVIFDLPDGEHATVIDGPVRADGYIWWKLAFADTRLITTGIDTGWVVQQVDTVETLIPAENDLCYTCAGDDLTRGDENLP